MKRLAVLFLTLGIATGCNHITTKVPGVLDMRTDGSEAQTVSAAPPGARSGFDGFLMGEGVQAAGPQVKVEDRKYWALRLFTIANESATEEISQAIGDGALRNVSIGDRFTLMDWAAGFVVSLIPCVGGFFVPPLSATFEGTRIGASAASSTPPVGDPTGGAL